MSTQSETPEIIIRMGSHAEKDYIVKLARFLDGLLVGGNLFESTPAATASLLVSVQAKRTQVFIDPMTYAFGAYTDHDGTLRRDLDWIKSEQTRKNKKTGKKEIVREFKRSYQSLATAFGEPLSSAMAKGVAIAPGSLRGVARHQQFCRRVLEYQRDRIGDMFKEDEDLKAYVDDEPRVSAVFAPYFYIEPAESEAWLELNLELISTSASIDVGIPVHAIICADVKHLDDQAFLERLVESSTAKGLSGMWLWFSRFYEDEESESRLHAYATLVKSIARNASVYSLHGGLFSMALSAVGMRGVSHGVGYGEQKDVKPVLGQSVPTVRYYLPAIAKRLGVPQIERAFDALGIHTPSEFYERVCACAVCRGVVVDSLDQFAAFGEMRFSRPGASRQSQTPAAAKRCRFHFLLARLQQRNELRKQTVEDVLASWREAQETWGSQPSLDASHLAIWSSVIRNVSE